MQDAYKEIREERKKIKERNEEAIKEMEGMMKEIEGVKKDMERLRKEKEEQSKWCWNRRSTTEMVGKFGWFFLFVHSGLIEDAICSDKLRPITIN